MSLSTTEVISHNRPDKLVRIKCSLGHESEVTYRRHRQFARWGDACPCPICAAIDSLAPEPSIGIGDCIKHATAAFESMGETMQKVAQAFEAVGKSLATVTTKCAEKQRVKNDAVANA